MLSGVLYGARKLRDIADNCNNKIICIHIINVFILSNAYVMVTLQNITIVALDTSLGIAIYILNETAIRYCVSLRLLLFDFIGDKAHNPKNKAMKIQVSMVVYSVFIFINRCYYKALHQMTFRIYGRIVKRFTDFVFFLTHVCCLSFNPSFACLFVFFVHSNMIYFVTREYVVNEFTSATCSTGLFREATGSCLHTTAVHGG